MDGGIVGLIHHLRNNPKDADVQSLAARFGVDPSVAMAAVRRFGNTTAARQVETRAPRSSLWQRWGRWFERETVRPVRFVFVTTLLWVVVCLSLVALVSLTTRNVPGATSVLYSLVPAIVTLAHLTFQSAGVARSGRPSHVALGGVLFGGIIALGSSWSNPLILQVVLLLTFCYLVLSFFVYSLCRQSALNAERKNFLSMDRQELLDRLIDVRRLIASAQADQRGPPGTREGAPTRFGPLIAVGLGAAAALVSEVTSWIGGGSVQADATSTFVQATLISVSFFAYAGASAVAGAYSRGLGASALSSLLVTATTDGLGRLLHPNESPSWRSTVFVAVLGLMCAVIGQFTAAAYRHSRRKALLAAQDPVALGEELVDLEYLLTPTSGSLAVLAVDVCGSTAMKADADPIVAEWSFREYHKWAAEVCARYGGTVHSIAGDGAIVGLPTANSAVQAACRLLTEIDAFNQKVNRMDAAFRLRIGLHWGDVAGDLGEVQFTRVIDVAAHVESKTAVGGIGATEEFVSHYEGSEFVDTGQLVDGHRVLAYSLPTSTPDGAEPTTNDGSPGYD